MFNKTYHATHPDMMELVDNDQLRDRYLVTDLFVPGEVMLNYSHNERFVIGGAAPTTAPVSLPDQTEPASAAGRPFPARRNVGLVNVAERPRNTRRGDRQDTAIPPAHEVGHDQVHDHDGSQPVAHEARAALEPAVRRPTAGGGAGRRGRRFLADQDVSHDAPASAAGCRRGR